MAGSGRLHGVDRRPNVVRMMWVNRLLHPFSFLIHHFFTILFYKRAFLTFW